MEWISVKDRLPEDHQRVLTYDPQAYCRVDIHKFYLDYGRSSGPWFIGDQNHHLPGGMSITHWAELPSEVPAVECSNEECVHHGTGGEVCIQCEERP